MRHNLDILTRPAILEGMKTIIDSKLLERLRVGPLSPFLDIYLTRVGQEGFLPSSVPCQVYAIARFSRWLERMNVPLEDLDESGVRDFLGRDPGVVHNLERSTIRRLVVVLREVGVLRAKQPATLTAVQSHVAEYRRYLIQQRGLAESCLPNYTSFVEKFLSDRFAESEPCLALPQHVEATGELRPVHVLAALLLNVNWLAFRRLQSVNLQLWGLVGCGDSRIADDHFKDTITSVCI